MNKFEEVYLKIISEENENLNQSYAPYKHGDWILSIKRYATPDNNFFTWDAKNLKTGQHWIMHNKKEHATVTDALAEIEEELDKKEYTAIFSFEEGTEIKADNFLDCKKAAYKYAEQSDRTEIRIFDPAGNLILSTLYSKEGFDNGTHFKKIKGDEF